MLRYWVIIFLINCCAISAFCQSEKFNIVLPDTPGWNEVVEGEKLSFTLKASLQNQAIRYSMRAPAGFNIDLDSAGNFSWYTEEGFVPDNELKRSQFILFYAESPGEKDSIFTELIVHGNRQEGRVEEANNNIPNIVTAIELPKKAGWNLLHEGDMVQFEVKPVTSLGSANGLRFYMDEGEKSSISFGSDGNFEWEVPFDMVDRLEQTREKHIFLIAEDTLGNIISQKVVFTIFHKNRPPVVNNTQPFYVVLGTNNVMNLKSSSIMDPDGDPIVFVVEPVNLPQGMDFSSSGKISWTPSRRQFNDLRSTELKIPFFVEDQPGKARTLSHVTVQASNLDMPPDVNIVPGDTLYKLKENERLHLVFHLSDPNGDDDIDKFEFISEDLRLKKDLLVKNTNTQYEFIWMPGFDFVNDPDLFLEFSLRFFVFDKSGKSVEKVIKLRINDTEDLTKKDAENYEIYHDLLVETLNLIDQLEENQKELEKELKKAKKGKITRAIVNASFGAITGISPLIQNDNASKAVGAIGGTTTMTLGTVEATVIGAAISTVNDKMKINIELRGQFLSEGSSFSRRYNSKANRRNKNYSYDIEKMRTIINSPKLSTLELDANWENKKKVNLRRLKTTFADFDTNDN